MLNKNNQCVYMRNKKHEKIKETYKKNWRTEDDQMFGFFFCCFNGISTFEGYLMPKLFS